MDIREIKGTKADLELEIGKILNRFERDTDTKIDSIKFIRKYAESGVNEIYDVDLSISIDGS